MGTSTLVSQRILSLFFFSHEICAFPSFLTPILVCFAFNRCWKPQWGELGWTFPFPAEEGACFPFLPQFCVLAFPFCCISDELVQIKEIDLSQNQIRLFIRMWTYKPAKNGSGVQRVEMSTKDP